MPRPIGVVGERERGEGGEDLLLRGPGDEQHALILEVPLVAAVAEAVEEFEEGLVALAAPVRGPEGTVIAAVSAAGPAYRLAPERLPEAAEVLRAATEEISRRLSHRCDLRDL